MIRPAILLAVVLAPAAWAQPVYEDRLIRWALDRAQLEAEPEPEGKVVERVEVVREEVFARSDLYPTALNVFHVKTRDSVVRREVLLAPGDVYVPARAAETERNLRRLFFLAVAKVVAARGADGKVIVVVATKDKWSLRLSNSFTLIGPLLQFLQLQLTEANFNGWGQSLSVGMILRLDTLALSQSFSERRLFGSRLSVAQTAGVVFGRQSGGVEGTFGQVTFGQRLITLDQEWGFLLDGSWNVRRRRVFRGATVWEPEPPPEVGDPVPLIYDVREGTAEASLTRSLGRALKLDLTAAGGFWLRQYRPPEEALLSAAQRDWLTATYLPRSETVAYGTVSARAFPADFKVLRNIDTFELSEDYQLGWLVQGGARLGVPVAAAQPVFVEVGAAVRYRLYRLDDLFTVTVAGAARLRLGQPAANQRVAAELTNYSPPLYGGRLVTRLVVDFKWNDLDNRQLLLGGSTGLRGAFPEQLVGRNMMLANVEYRARPLELVPATWLGLVLFYDVGSAFDTTVAPVHSVGMGLRLLFPQLNAEVLRVDLGLVLGGPVPGADRLNASWGQITDLRPDFLDQPL